MDTIRKFLRNFLFTSPLRSIHPAGPIVFSFFKERTEKRKMFIDYNFFSLDLLFNNRWGQSETATIKQVQENMNLFLSNLMLEFAYFITHYCLIQYTFSFRQKCPLFFHDVIRENELHRFIFVFRLSTYGQYIFSLQLIRFVDRWN